MENKKSLHAVLIIVVIILSVTLYKQFDIKHFRFQKPGLALVYMTGLIIAISFLLRKTKT